MTRGEKVNAIREDWTDPRTNLKYIRGEIEAIRALRSGDAENKGGA